MKFRYAIAVACSLLVVKTLTAQNILSYAAYDKMEAWADSVMAELSPDERLGQLIIPIVANTDNQECRNVIKSHLEKYHIGGLHFSKGTLASQEALTKYGQSKSRVPLMISTDSEWGLYMRLTDAVRFPRNMSLGCINHEPDAAGKTLRDSLMYEYGNEIGRECRAMGIAVNYAPVLDVNNNPKNPVIGIRSFGDNMQNVAAAALSYAAGVEDAGVMAVAKHFPGHGDTDKDSHKTLPLLSHTQFRMESFEMQPFNYFTDAGFGGIMVAHLEVPSLEPTQGMPSSASKNIINGYLREKFGFNGLVFTDGLAMEGAKKFPNICAKSLNAGTDILLDAYPLAEQWKNLKAALNSGELTQELIDYKCKRVLMFKYALNINQNPDRKQIDHDYAMALSKLLYQESLVLLKNEKPLKGSQIISVTDAKKETVARVAQQVKAAKKTVTLVFYSSPYVLTSYKNTIAKAASVILAHEDYKYAHEAVQNAIDGKANFRGQLGVEIPELYPINSGIMLNVVENPQPLKRNFSVELPEPVAQAAQETERPSSIPEVDNQELAEIDALVNDGLAKGAYPGCQVLVMKDGKIIYNKAFGYYDSSKTRKVSTESIYDLASVSKAAATLPALMMAVDEYDISISDKLSKYIPELRGTDKKNLTLKQALFHETGMRDSYPFYGLTIDSASVNGRLYQFKKDANYSILQDKNTYFHKGLKWNKEWISESQNPTYPVQIAENLFIKPEFRAEILQKIIDLPLKNTGRYRYSDLNFVLLRQLIENVTSRSLDAYLQEKLFTPLGLTHCGYNLLQNSEIDKTLLVPTENDEAIRKQLLRGYVHDELAAWSGGVEGNAGLFSNATDLAKILQTFLDKGFYSEKTLRLFTTTKSSKSRRGLGFDKPDMANKTKSPCADVVPGTVFGHTGYTGTCFWVDPTNKLIYIFLSNRVNPSRLNNKLTAEGYRSKIQAVLYKK